ncbi:concanavalin A-like lectin/glucanase [Artomyces pyxidatus]|uniref:Concanavalin A-like lectin/glucanase n=1 Tax=Artomyces pyxidatus TaxID=48021 RepID=A0ACB8SG82_9AGAM|nr:concanavalin A-like lectin/glucanase [Artomyces pyxidatus]
MASYRRNRYSHTAVPRRSSTDDDDGASSSHRLSGPRPSSPLSPPRPAFLSQTRERGSWSSHDASSLDSAPPSDSERDTPPTIHSSLQRQSRRASGGAYAPVDTETPPASASILSPSQSLRSATALPPAPTQYSDDPTSVTPRSSRAPPSAYPFPFQAYPGNPDPGMSIPGLGLKSRRTSMESLNAAPRRPTSASGTYAPVRTSVEASGSVEGGDLERPYAPFMAGGAGGVYRQPESRGSTHSFRAPFLSPASRPSSVWSPPSHASASYPMLPASPNITASQYEPLKSKPPLPSTLLNEKLAKEDKPWLVQKQDRRTRGSWWVTMLTFFIGVGVAGVLCWRGYDDFDTLDVDNGGTWARDVEMSGFGNGEFEMATAESGNLYTRNSQLYIMPTYTSDALSSPGMVLNGGNYTLKGCTTTKTNASACSASSNSKTGATIPPVMSARINTKASYSIQFGKVEVVAKLPRGDWLWPAIWMLPVDNKYGAWPLSGEIDLMEARGNMPTYPAQGNNFARASLAWGPLPGLVARAYGWQSQKRSNYAQGFHTYTLEWTPDFMKVYVDSRLQAMLDLKVNSKAASEGGYFWHRGGFPVTAQNNSATPIVVPNPWAGASEAAPFDQSFYLIISLAAGGTSGWFPDNKGGKMWYDGSASAMRDFASHQDEWSATWPSSDDDRAFRIDSVKMWKLC